MTPELAEMAANSHRARGRIVVGLDGSATAAAAVRWAIREARQRQARLHLVSADDHDQGQPRAMRQRTGPATAR